MNSHQVYTKNLITLLVIITVGCIGQKSIACSCIGEATVKEEIKRQDAVLVGTIVESEEIRIYDTLSPSKTIYRVEIKYTLVVETVYKGRQVSDTAFIFTGSGGGDCGYNFQLGQKYIVYAGNFMPDERYNSPVSTENISSFYTSICTRTRPYNEEEIEEIEKYKKKKI
jgi:hypothetical protein